MWTSQSIRWGGALGFALGGFFDGILLHQILQWHHLLSLVSGFADIRMQILWDGYFHALMYVIAIAGLWGLWKAQKSNGEGRRRQIAGALAIGFGLWHIVDGVLSHWLLDIHRIKLDSPNPLFWDLIWFCLFGVLPLVIGWFILRGDRGKQEAGKSTATLVLLSFATASAGIWSSTPLLINLSRPWYSGPALVLPRFSKH